jgi:hypothetical protein
MPRDNRQHFVFVKAGGCTVAVTLKHSRHGARDEDHAWRLVYETPRAQREAAARGTRCVLVDHATYLRDHAESMREGCTHEAVSVDG